ncbi:hypothetical protein QOT17_012231 [Balamuthia mandrillaris]
MALANWVVLLFFVVAISGASLCRGSYLGDYHAVDSPPFQFVSLVGDGLALNMQNANYTWLRLDFTFPFDGEEYDQAAVVANGLLAFGTPTTGAGPYCPLHLSLDGGQRAFAFYWTRITFDQPDSTQAFIKQYPAGECPYSPKSLEPCLLLHFANMSDYYDRMGHANAFLFASGDMLAMVQTCHNDSDSGSGKCLWGSHYESLQFGVSTELTSISYPFHTRCPVGSNGWEDALVEPGEAFSFMFVAPCENNKTLREDGLGCRCQFGFSLEADLSCQPCSSQVSDGLTCETCGEDEYAKWDWSGCSICPPDQRIAADNTTCESCPMGSVPNSEQTDCQACQGNQRVSDEGYSCEDCPSGTEPDSTRTFCVQIQDPTSSSDEHVGSASQRCTPFILW